MVVVDFLVGLMVEGSSLGIENVNKVLAILSVELVPQQLSSFFGESASSFGLWGIIVKYELRGVEVLT